jgi:hypothetical protein
MGFNAYAQISTSIYVMRVQERRPKYALKPLHSRIIFGSLECIPVLQDSP